jgi:hypothetical protein
MDPLSEKRDEMPPPLKHETPEQDRQEVAEIIEMVDQDLLDVLRSRIVEQEVLDLIDEPAAR